MIAARAVLDRGALLAALGWRARFFLPGVFAVLTEVAYLALLRRYGVASRDTSRPISEQAMRPGWPRMHAVVAVVTVMVALQFNATMVATSKLPEERLAAVVTSTAGIGLVAALIYATAAFVQIAVGMALVPFPVRPLLMTIAAGQALAMAIAGISEGWAMAWASRLVMVLVFAQVPIGSTLIARYVPPVCARGCMGCSS